MCSITKIGTANDVDLKQCELVAIEAAKKAGKLISETWGKASSIEAKGSYADLVTSTDKEAENIIFSILREKFPNHKFIGEETTAAAAASSPTNNKLELTDEPTWIVDPVDGTMNFVHATPFVAVSIGLAVNKRPVLGIVFCPILDKLYKATKGNGAYCNDTKICVSVASSLREALVCIEIGSQRDEVKRKNTFENLNSVAWQCHGIRALGSAATDACYVASGHFNAFYEFGLWPWDMCAATIITEEAGGYVCDTDGGQFDMMKRRWIVASSKQLALELAKALPNQLELSCN